MLPKKNVEIVTFMDLCFVYFCELLTYKEISMLMGFMRAIGGISSWFSQFQIHFACSTYYEAIHASQTKAERRMQTVFGVIGFI